MSTPAKPPDGQNDVYWLIGLAVAAVVALGYFTGNGPAGSFQA